MSVVSNRKKVTIATFAGMKRKGKKIAILTAYDYAVATLLDRAGIDALLVGDSAANVVHGFSSTLPISMDVMVAHTAAVARGCERAMVIADMPFLSFQPSYEVAITNAGRFLKEGGAEAVKVEGGLEMAPTIRRIIDCGIPVMGHIGLTPQAIHRIGGPKVQGRTEQSRNYLLESARALEEAGCFAMVLELIEQSVAAEITSSVSKAATIGIGAGPGCDGQVLVINDILGLRNDEFKPTFLREYANLSPIIREAAERFINDVRASDYPNDSESFSTKK